MGWVALYAVLTAAFLGSLFFPSGSHWSIADSIKVVTGSAAAVGALSQALARVHLPTYLFLQRARIWWASDQTSHWRFALRLDGFIAENPITLVLDSFSDCFSQWHPKVLSSGSHEALLLLDRTIHLQLSFVPSSESEDGESHLLIQSHELEVSYGVATRKIDTTIVPIISAFTSLLRAANTSSMFEVSFDKPNPFFGFYVEHLNAEQVTHFNLVFKPRISHGTEADRVTVTAKTVEITAGTIDAFCRLAKAFLLLSFEAITLTKG